MLPWCCHDPKNSRREITPFRTPISRGRAAGAGTIRQNDRGDFFAGLTYYANLSHLPLKKACLIYGGNERQARNTGRVIPWQNVTDCYKSHNG